MGDAPCDLGPGFATFDDAYLANPLWEIGRPQPALAELVTGGEVSGRVLDAGCGTGELTLFAAARGIAVTGVDSAPRAIEIARTRAASRGLSSVVFEVADVLDPPFEEGSFDTVLDSGVFHVFDDADRRRYVESVHRLLTPGGLYHMLVFSDAEPPGWGPRRVRRDELELAFAAGWRLRTVEASIFELRGRPSARAWRATAIR